MVVDGQRSGGRGADHYDRFSHTASEPALEAVAAAKEFDDFSEDTFSKMQSEKKFNPASLAARLMDESETNPFKDRPDLQQDELLTFMFAGHDTTASTLAWCIYELCRNPEIQAKVQAEVDECLEKLDGRQVPCDL